ncbi:hypothetical protein BAZMOX_00840_5 [methanotrophic endosymbiont of Bathymodiolus azoricus (Menez Gwen)]|jgi:prepilin signal peptidase PulO-like enzyme (type II secretory pathway)|nr:hypothetical protein BAZMOX_00840_5 [methanotrophic endosymbiont of Bathymodiolus azoricus (Menez Gwen)]
MGLNIESESSKGVRGYVAIMGMLIIILGMVASVQADGSVIPDIMMLVGLIVVLVAEKSSLNEGPNN